MRCVTKFLYLFFFISFTVFKVGYGQKVGQYSAIYSGIPWFDDHGNVISAHGANILKYKDKYYLFGEAHTDTSNAFAGFNCYSSADLYNWKFERTAFPVQQSGRLGPNRVGERVKVLHCPKTGEFIMLMHTDTLGYRDPCICYATSASPAGPYVFQGPLLFNGQPVKKWDMGSFQDADGCGYLLVHGGNIFKLAEDYKSISEQVLKDMSPECESPAVFKKDNLYYWLASSRTSWERNDNFYYTATSLKGPWTFMGSFAPKGTLTWDSQTTFVLPIAGATDTTYLFIGDRWSFPRQASSATYVWQPLMFTDAQIEIPQYKQGWRINTVAGLITDKISLTQDIPNSDKRINYTGVWSKQKMPDGLLVRSSSAKNDSFSIKFTGRQIGLYMLAGPQGGYARVELSNEQGKIILTAIIDNYCKYPVSTVKFITPVLAKGTYILKVSVMGEHGNWSDKRHSNFGSTGDLVALGKVVMVN